MIFVVNMMGFLKVNILESALSVHEKLISKDIVPLHQHLVQRFAQMQKSMSTTSPTSLQHGTPVMRKSNSIVNTPLPPGIKNPLWLMIYPLQNESSI